MSENNMKKIAKKSFSHSIDDIELMIESTLTACQGEPPAQIKDVLILSMMSAGMLNYEEKK